MRHIAHEHGSPVNLLDRKRVDRLDHIRRVIHRQGVVLVADFDVARGQYDVLMLQRRAHIGGRQSPGLQGLHVQIRHDHSRLATVGVRHFRAMDDGQGGTNDVLTQVIELGIGQ